MFLTWFTDVLVYFIYLHRYHLRHRFRNFVFSWHLWIHEPIFFMAHLIHSGWLLWLIVGLILTPCTATATPSADAPFKSLAIWPCDLLPMTRIHLEGREPARTARSSRWAEILFIQSCSPNPVHQPVGSTSISFKKLWLIVHDWREFSVIFFSTSGIISSCTFHANYTPPCQLCFPKTDPIRTSMLRIPNSPSGPRVNRWNVTFRRAKIHANGVKMVDMFA